MSLHTALLPQPKEREAKMGQERPPIGRHTMTSCSALRHTAKTARYRNRAEPMQAETTAASYAPPRPAFAHCSSWSPVTPLTPMPPVTLPSAMIGMPPGEAKTPGRVAVAGALLIASMKTRVVRR